jgi:hypothetical protein
MEQQRHRYTEGTDKFLGEEAVNLPQVDVIGDGFRR